jgi:protein-disulfide isomerase
MEESDFKIEKKGRDVMLPVSIIIAGFLIAGSVIYSINIGGGTRDQANLQNLENQENISPPKIENYDAVLGNEKAPVTLIEFGDFQCPFCGKFFTETESLIRENYIKKGLVKMVWRDFAFLGPESLVAAESAHCAKDQGKFWEYHDALMIEEQKDGREHNGNLNDTKFKEIAKELKMNLVIFEGCLKSGKHKETIKESYNSAVKSGVQSTPTVFVNSQKVQGALPYDSFRELIEAELK